MAERRNGWLRRGERLVRRVLPRSFMGRSLLIVLIPLLVTQGVALGLFYGTHLHTVSRRLSDSVAAEMALAMDAVRRNPQDQARIFADVRQHTQVSLSIAPHAPFPAGPSSQVLGPVDDDLRRAVSAAFREPCRLEWDDAAQLIRVEVPLVEGGVLTATIPRKRLDTEPIWLFVAWASGSALALFLLATWFTGKQVRAVRRLAEAAESFGQGRDPGPIEPQGALEIRKAAVAFNRMQARVNRFVAQRTAVLAGVSHDLRTPLTRLRLTLAMLPIQGQVPAETLREDVEDMVSDIAEMERLIGSYLSFARGEGAETPVPTDLRALVEEVAQAASRAGGQVIAIHAEDAVMACVRPDAMRRVLTNLAENARRHGGRMAFSVRRTGREAEIILDDDGPGIAPARRRQVFRAYDAAGPSGGNGLGLTIARDIVHAHGGAISLTDSPLGGLRVVLTIPV
ncbi:ATP-binding protein [Acidomonas methanolica]|uniref:ATP-binding protein n=1 Tax=Acidomonas methanolica TaxID=437 RepID=UPI00211A95E1|nr:ATP-binding protein [Acidomonas methanolica]MCQ9154823.1 HAMP domain-containing protein [Acidomonas methanolica]